MGDRATLITLTPFLLLPAHLSAPEVIAMGRLLGLWKVVFSLSALALGLFKVLFQHLECVSTRMFTSDVQMAIACPFPYSLSSLMCLCNPKAQDAVPTTHMSSEGKT